MKETPAGKSSTVTDRNDNCTPEVEIDGSAGMQIQFRPAAFWKDTVSILPDGPEAELQVAELCQRDVLGTRTFGTPTFGVGHLLAYLQCLERDALEAL